MQKRTYDEFSGLSFKKQKSNDNSSYNKYNISELIQIKKKLNKDVNEINKVIDKIDDIIKMY